MLSSLKDYISAPFRYLKSLVTPPTHEEIAKLASELKLKRENLELLCETEIIKCLKERFPDECPVLMLYSDDRVKGIKSELYSEYSKKLDSHIIQLETLDMMI